MGCASAGNAGTFSPPPRVSGHVGGGENVPRIPGACAAQNITYLAIGTYISFCHLMSQNTSLESIFIYVLRTIVKGHWNKIKWLSSSVDLQSSYPYDESLACSPMSHRLLMSSRITKYITMGENKHGRRNCTCVTVRTDKLFEACLMTRDICAISTKN